MISYSYLLQGSDGNPPNVGPDNISTIFGQGFLEGGPVQDTNKVIVKFAEPLTPEAMQGANDAGIEVFDLNQG